MSELTLGQKVRAAREQRGLSQLELALTMRSSQPYVCCVECDKKLPSLKWLRRFSRVCHVELSLTMVKDPS